MNKIALITGINGQDGTYLAELLLSKNYRVVGFSKNKLSPHISYLKNEIELINGDLAHPDSIYHAIKSLLPDEIYNLASQSYPNKSWHLAIETMKINGIGAHHLFEAARHLKLDCRIYQASSSEMFGESNETPQNEQTPLNPSNPYAAAKVYAHNIAKIYRKSYGMFISCGILFNHESPRRGLHFITQKIAYAVACIKLGITTSPLLNEKGDPIVNNGKLSLGNLDAKRDWGYAGDYVETMWLMLQQSNPDDFIIGTGIIKTIRDLCETAFSHVGLDWKKYVIVDNQLVRPTETGPTVADIHKIKSMLGWKPKKSFEELIADLVNHHLQTLTHCHISHDTKTIREKNYVSSANN